MSLASSRDVKDVTIRIRRIPVETHRRWRAQAALRGITMNDAVIEALQVWLEQQASEEAQSAPR